MSFNYPTAAAAASDLGGIERARGKAAMTIGLRTITAKLDAKVIIMAAGEGKASVVRAAIEDPPSVDRPASVLQGLPNARFYLTHGAAMKLTARKQEQVSQISPSVLVWSLSYLSGALDTISPYLIKPSPEYSLLESCLYDASLALNTPVHILTLEQVLGAAGLVQLPAWLQQDQLAFQLLCSCASRRLKDKIDGGLIESSPQSLRVLHTAPHHDDIMLSYHGAMHEMLGRQAVINVNRVSIIADHRRSTSSASMLSMPYGSVRQQSKPRSGSFTSYLENVLGEAYNNNLNHFAYLTSGFHSVNDDFLLSKTKAALGGWNGGHTPFVEEAVKTGQLGREYDDLMSLFREAFFDKDLELQNKIENIIFLRKVAEVWQIPLAQSYATLVQQIKAQVTWIQDEYLAHHQPGDAVPKDMQLLKGCMRESEVDRVWALSQIPMNRIHHMRSK